jgi:hypothetical protein
VGRGRTANLLMNADKNHGVANREATNDMLCMCLNSSRSRLAMRAFNTWLANCSVCKPGAYSAENPNLCTSQSERGAASHVEISFRGCKGGSGVQTPVQRALPQHETDEGVERLDLRQADRE